MKWSRLGFPPLQLVDDYQTEIKTREKCLLLVLNKGVVTLFINKKNVFKKRAKISETILCIFLQEFCLEGRVFCTQLNNFTSFDQKKHIYTTTFFSIALLKLDVFL